MDDESGALRPVSLRPDYADETLESLKDESLAELMRKKAEIERKLAENDDGFEAHEEARRAELPDFNPPLHSCRL